MNAVHAMNRLNRALHLVQVQVSRNVVEQDVQGSANYGPRSLEQQQTKCHSEQWIDFKKISEPDGERGHNNNEAACKSLQNVPVRPLDVEICFLRFVQEIQRYEFGNRRAPCRQKHRRGWKIDGIL